MFTILWRFRHYDTTPETMFIVHLMSFKWDEKHPRPGMTKIAKRMGITPTAVRNAARKLENSRNLLKRTMRVGRPNLFDLSPLFAALEKMIAADDKERKAKEKAA